MAAFLGKWNAAKVLGVSPNASEEEVRAAYRKRALETHPDKNGKGDDQFLQVKEAYDTLQSTRTRWHHPGRGQPPAANSKANGGGVSPEGDRKEEEEEGSGVGSGGSGSGSGFQMELGDLSLAAHLLQNILQQKVGSKWACWQALLLSVVGLGIMMASGWVFFLAILFRKSRFMPFVLTVVLVGWGLLGVAGLHSYTGGLSVAIQRGWGQMGEEERARMRCYFEMAAGQVAQETS